MKVKICGITNVEDALQAEKSGADAIGLIFYEHSKRSVSLEKAIAICKALGVFTTKVGVFVDAEYQHILAVAKQLRLNAIQLHGQETSTDILKIKEQFPVIKAFAINEIDLQILYNSPADANLIDSPVPGSGKAFDWSKASALQNFPRLILAGGLTPKNVVEAIKIFKPYAVDVSSGVEASYGKKDPQKVKDFILAAKR